MIISQKFSLYSLAVAKQMFMCTTFFQLILSEYITVTNSPLPPPKKTQFIVPFSFQFPLPNHNQHNNEYYVDEMMYVNRFIVRQYVRNVNHSLITTLTSNQLMFVRSSHSERLAIAQCAVKSPKCSTSMLHSANFIMNVQNYELNNNNKTTKSTQSFETHLSKPRIWCDCVFQSN